MRREHPRADVDVVLVDLGINQNAGRRIFCRPHGEKYRRARLPRRARPGLHFGKNESCAAGSDAGTVVAGFDSSIRDTAGRGHEFGRDLRRRPRAAAARRDARRRHVAPSFSSEIGTRPAFSSKTTRSPATSCHKLLPARASTKAVPTLGWPANGISSCGVKIRTSAVCAACFGGSTKVVSARLNSAAMACICAGRQPFRVQHDRKRIAAELIVREHIDGFELRRHAIS